MIILFLFLYNQFLKSIYNQFFKKYINDYL
jgi:hypothetical protein